MWLGILCIGAGVGFTAGLFGKGGSAIATPLLHLVGVPALVAVAAPLPATIPSTVAAARPYWRADAIDWRLVRISVVAGAPAAVVGAVLTRWVDGSALVRVTDALIAIIGVRLLLTGRRPAPTVAKAIAGDPLRRSIAVGIVVGITSGLLANSGGFLLAPLYLSVLHRPIRTAFGSSLAVAAVLAVPGTIVHAALGHIDWKIVLLFGVAAVPLSALGARVALRVEPSRLERGYGAVLVLLGGAFLLS